MGSAKEGLILPYLGVATPSCGSNITNRLALPNNRLIIGIRQLICNYFDFLG
jgi:hypothetical protein